MTDIVHNLHRMEQQLLTSGAPTGMVAVIGEARQEIERLRAALQDAERDARKWRLQEARAKHL